MNAESDNHISFSRDLNLLIESDLTTFMQESESSGYSLSVSTEKELQQLIEFGREFLPDSAFTISGGSFTPIYVRPKFAVDYNFVEIILPVISFLHRFQGNMDFIGKTKVNINNLAQFDDTIFELRCLKQFSDNGFSFQYEPSVIIGCKGKKPDFKLTKDNLDLFVECKQVRMGQGKGQLQFGKQCRDAQDRFPKKLGEHLLNKKLRLEVNFIKIPSERDLDDLCRRINKLYDNVQKLNELPLQQVGDSIEFVIVGQSKPSIFPMKAMRLGKIIVGTESRRIWNPATDSPEGEILFTSTDLVRRRRKTLVNLIREAKNQLPDNEFGIIILGKTNLTIAVKEIENRMNGNQYRNIMAFIVNPFDDFWSCYRTHYRGLLSDLFEGFQTQNPFRQTD